MYPGATSVELHRYARAAVQDARGWTAAKMPPHLPVEEQRVVESSRLLAVCSLLTEAAELRDLARERRP